MHTTNSSSLCSCDEWGSSWIAYCRPWPVFDFLPCFPIYYSHLLLFLFSLNLRISWLLFLLLLHAYKWLMCMNGCVLKCFCCCYFLSQFSFFHFPYLFHMVSYRVHFFQLLTEWWTSWKSGVRLPMQFCNFHFYTSKSYLLFVRALPLNLITGKKNKALTGKIREKKLLTSESSFVDSFQWWNLSPNQ